MKRHDYGAGYRLNEAVKCPTQALKRAAGIGVLIHEEESFPEKAAKEAMLVVSYGAAGEAAYEASLATTMEAIAEKHPGVTITQAFTSEVMIRRFAANTGIRLPRPEAALEGLVSQGFTRVALVSLDFFPGLDYSLLTEIFQAYRARFKKLVLGTPLMYWMAQEEQRDDVADFVTALGETFPPRKMGEAVLLMGHGTPHPSNAFYAVLQDRLDTAGWEDVFVYTMEGWPRLAHILPRLKERQVKRVLLMPLMMAVGKHVKDDMAGEGENSHRSILTAAGFTVEPYLHGLGESCAVRRLYVRRAEEAWDALRTEGGGNA